jgi:hydrogenase nickel incorporation protein HypA/HybF
MHELSVVQHIAETLEDFAAENGIEKIAGVTLDIGQVSGILYDYFEDCWNWFREKSPLLSGAALHVNVIPAVNYCEACGHTYRAIPAGRICPACGSERTWLKTGLETIIREIEVEDEDGCDPAEKDDP